MIILVPGMAACLAAWMLTGIIMEPVIREQEFRYAGTCRPALCVPAIIALRRRDCSEPGGMGVFALVLLMDTVVSWLQS